MKLLVTSCLLVLLASEAWSQGYHEDVGIPAAAQLRQNEAQSLSLRIVGGTVSKWADNPHLVGVLVQLMNGQQSVCAGSLISQNKVITAGQCWYDGYQRSRKLQVVIDTLRLFSASRREIAGVAVHPGFNPYTPVNDLAILTLVSPVYFYRDVQAVMLPSPVLNNTMSDMVGAVASISGFGKNNDWSSIGPNSVQQHASVSVVNYWQCYQALGPAVTSDTICADGGIMSVGPCAGDLGAPLVIKNYDNGNSSLLIGVASIMPPMGCQDGFPTGYVKVSSYIGWIQSNL